jgi:DNA modification methylase
MKNIKGSIEIKCRGAGTLALDLLTPAQGELKHLTDDNAERLRNEMLTDGFIEPISVWEDPESGNVYILNGHQRFEVLKRLRDEGYKIPQLPVSYVEATSINDAKRKILALASQYGSISSLGLKNIIDDLGIDESDVIKYFTFPEINIASLLSGLDETIIIGSGIESNLNLNGDVEKDLKNVDMNDSTEVEGEDNIPDAPKVAKTKLGDIYELGNHRLMCGDSTDLDSVKSLMNGEKADFTITSPPYNVGLKYNQYDDKKSESDYLKLLNGVLTNIKQICSEDYWILWNVGVYPLSLHLSLLRNYFTIERSISWVKQGTTGPPVFYHTQQNPVSKNYNPNFSWEIIACGHLNKTLKGTRPIPKEVLDECPNDVWQISQHKDARDQGKHPGAFPVKIAERSIHLFAENNVYEPFGGSGSTLIACEKTDRKAFVMELDPTYCDIIVARWENFTGEKAKLLKKTVIRKK